MHYALHQLPVSERALKVFNERVLSAVITEKLLLDAASKALSECSITAATCGQAYLRNETRSGSRIIPFLGHRQHGEKEIFGLGLLSQDQGLSPFYSCDRAGTILLGHMFFIPFTDGTSPSCASAALRTVSERRPKTAAAVIDLVLRAEAGEFLMPSEKSGPVPGAKTPPADEILVPDLASTTLPAWQPRNFPQIIPVPHFKDVAKSSTLWLTLFWNNAFHRNGPRSEMLTAFEEFNKTFKKTLWENRDSLREVFESVATRLANFPRSEFMPDEMRSIRASIEALNDNAEYFVLAGAGAYSAWELNRKARLLFEGLYRDLGKVYQSCCAKISELDNNTEKSESNKAATALFEFVISLEDALDFMQNIFARNLSRFYQLHQ